LRQRKKERGSAFILTIFLAMLILTATVGYLSILLDEIQLMGSHYSLTQAFYLAEAGISRSASQLRENPNYSAWFPQWLNSDQPFFNGFYQVNLTSSPSKNIIFLTSWGKLPLGPGKMITKQVLAQVEFFQSVFNYAIFAGQGIEGENSKITGNIATNNPLDSLKLSSCSLQGSAYANSNLLIPVLVEEDYNSSQVKSWPTGSSVILKGGFYLVKGDLNISSTVKVEGKGLVYVRGKINLNGKIKGKIKFLANDDIIVGNNNELMDVLLYSKKNIYLGENTQLKGCLLANGQVKLSNGCSVEYSSPYEITNWQYKTYAP